MDREKYIQYTRESMEEAEKDMNRHYALYEKSRKEFDLFRDVLKKFEELNASPSESLGKVRYSVKEHILNILSKADRPMLAKELHQNLIDVTGKDMPFGSFSAQLSPLVGDEIKKQGWLGFPMRYRNWYGLPKWFDGQYIKNEYYTKILKRVEELEEDELKSVQSS